MNSRTRKLTSLVVVLLTLLTTGLVASPAPAGAATSEVGDIITFSVPNVVDPGGMARSPNGSIWFTSRGTGRVGRINAQGIIQTFTDWRIEAPTDIVYFGGYMWFTNSGPYRIGRIDPTSGAISMFADTTGTTTALQIVVGADGGLWFTNGGYPAHTINRFDPVTHAFETRPIVGAATDITSGPDGALWLRIDNPYPQYDGVLRLAFDGEEQYFETPDRPSMHLEWDGGGNVWLAEPENEGATSISSLHPATGRLGPRFGGRSAGGGLTAAPDGCVWYVGDGDVRKYCSRGGLVATYHDPNVAGGYYTDMQSSADHRFMWFTNSNGRIGRIQVLP